MKARRSFSITMANMLKKIGVLLQKTFGGEFSIFLLFLVITFLFWFAQKMGKSYEYTMQIPVKIANVPEEIRLSGSASDKVIATLSGKGMALWKSSRNKDKVIEISTSAYKMSRGRAVLSSQFVRDSIQDIISSGVVIRSIEPDTLSFLYENQQIKRLPVRFDGVTEGKNQYVMDSYYVTPDSLDVYVTESAGNVDALYVDLASIDVDADTVTVSAKLKAISGVYADNDNVQLSVCSFQYTEKSLTIPVQGVNFPQGKMLKSFPSRVNVVFWVKMSEYDNVAEGDFTVVVDYNDIMQFASDKAELRIYNLPADVKRVRIIPQSVEFLVEDFYNVW